MKMKRMFSYVSVAALAAATVFAVPSAHASATPVAGALAAPAAQESWAVPPAELQGVEQQGFHDGIEGARKDAQNHRPPNVNNRDEYRHPSVPRHDWRAYRHGFRRGYQVGVEHLMHHDHDHDHYQ